MYRDDHAQEVAAVRKRLSEEEAFFKREKEAAKSAAAALQDSKLSLEGTVSNLTEKTEALAVDLKEEKEETERLSKEVG